MQHFSQLRRLALVLAIIAPVWIACSEDSGPPGVPRGPDSFGGSYAGPVTGPGSDASLPIPPDASQVGPDAKQLPCTAGSWDCTCDPGNVQSCSCDSGGSGTMRCRPSGAGFGPCMCAATANDKLGASCGKDAECGPGLTCLTPSSTALEGQGPAGGLCTRDCADDATVCDLIKTGAQCIGFPDQASTTRYCMEGCAFGGVASPTKCHGRVDMGCASITVPALGEVARACVPNCNSDADCGSGLFCDPATGTCAKTAAQGDPVGTPCSQSNDTCRGYCEKLDLPATSGSVTLCVERCTGGATAAGTKFACGWDGTSGLPASAACIYYPATNIQSGVGDRGACGQLCDCNSQCSASGLICKAFEGGLELLFKKKGQCTAPTIVDGGIEPGIVTCI